MSSSPSIQTIRRASRFTRLATGGVALMAVATLAGGSTAYADASALNTVYNTSLPDAPMVGFHLSLNVNAHRVVINAPVGSLISAYRVHFGCNGGAGGYHGFADASFTLKSKSADWYRLELNVDGVNWGPVAFCQEQILSPDGFAAPKPYGNFSGSLPVGRPDLAKTIYVGSAVVS